MMGYDWAGGGGWLWMLGGLLLVIEVIVLVVPSGRNTMLRDVDDEGQSPVACRSGLVS
ncbi:MAG: hypothetical protein M3Y88_03530 [Chloroflexota bacterium]|nr:hypothetical protein [Chloroflexota bacterium]